MFKIVVFAVKASLTSINNRLQSIMQNKRRVLIKYGGNAMVDQELQYAIFRQIKEIQNRGHQVVMVHGGGPFIQEVLDAAQVKSEFAGGHRITTPEALPFVEMALKGNVNGQLVRISNSIGLPAVGLSGKDGNTALATKRFHKEENEDGTITKVDIGRVGDLIKIDTNLPEMLLSGGYFPIFTCIASDSKGDDYNINADMFAGHMAGALDVDDYIVLTDVDGLMRDIKRIDSIVSELFLDQIPGLLNKVIKGGMIPKVESCEIALNNGAGSARILNGTKPEQLSECLLDKKKIGTTITIRN